MKSKHRIPLIFAGMVLLTMSGAFALLFYLFAHQEELTSRWVSLSFIGFVILVNAVGLIMIRHSSRKLAAEETRVEGERRRGSAAKAIKVLLVIYILGLLNGVRLIAQGVIPQSYAIVGMVVSVSFIVVLWRSLTKLKKFENVERITGQQS